jgi:spore maturation protein B
MTNYIIPIFILVIIVVALTEKKNVYLLFIEGIVEGVKIVYNIFPYIFAITIISGIVNDTGILKNINFLNISADLIPLIIMKPLSGGASTALVVDIFNKYGPDSFNGIFSSIIMASTETTIYVISIFSSKIKIKNMKLPIICGLIGDITAIILCYIVTKIIT